jgi:hypothetical protein
MRRPILNLRLVAPAIPIERCAENPLAAAQLARFASSEAGDGGASERIVSERIVQCGCGIVSAHS